MRAAILVRPVQWLVIAALALAGMMLLLGSSAGSAQAPATKTLTLTGAEEVPAVESATTGTFTWSATSTSLSFELVANGTALTMAHIHQGARGTNGPVVAFLFGPDTTGVNAIHVSGTITAANLIGPLAGNMQGFQDALKAGNLYANVHSVANPAGVIRAQLPATTTTAPGAPNTGTGTMGIDNAPSTSTLAGALLVGVAASAAAYSLRRKSSAR